MVAAAPPQGVQAPAKKKIIAELISKKSVCKNTLGISSKTTDYIYTYNAANRLEKVEKIRQIAPKNIYISPTKVSLSAEQRVTFTVSGTMDNGKGISDSMLDKTEWTSGSSNFVLEAVI